MNVIKSENIPEPGGHYSPCIEHNGLLYISGQLPFTTEKEMPDGIELQTKQALRNVQTILLAAGSDKTKVLQVRIYIARNDFWGPVNQVYSQFFGEHKPVRCIVPVPELHYGALLEIEATAIC